MAFSQSFIEVDGCKVLAAGEIASYQTLLPASAFDEHELGIPTS
jgi:hypothetical protein